MSDIKEWMMVNETDKFDDYFKKKGKSNWNVGDGFITTTYHRYTETGEYYTYQPAFCAADARLSWRKFANNSEEAIEKLDS